MYIYIPGYKSLLNCVQTPIVTQVPANVCLINHGDILGSIALYCGADMQELPGCTVLKFKTSEDATVFYNYAVQFYAFTNKSISGIYYDSNPIVHTLYTADMVCFPINSIDILRTFDCKANNPIPCLDIEHSMHLKKLFAVVMQFYYDCSINNLMHLTRAVLEDFDLLLMTLHECGMISAKLIQNKKYVKIDRSYTKSCFLQLSGHLNKELAAYETIVKKLEDNCEKKLESFVHARNIENKKEDELPMKGKLLDIPALYQMILETRNHFVHTTLCNPVSLNSFRDIMVICQTLYKISIVMFDCYYAKVMGRSVIQDFTACIPCKDLELRYRVSSKFPNLVCALSDDKLQKLFGEDICITRGSKQLTISYSDIQEFGVVFEY